MKHSQNVVIFLCNPDVDFEDDCVEVDLKFEYYYDSGRSYMSNGDPGYPAEEGLDIVEIYNEDDLPEWATDDVIEDYIYENLHDLLEDSYED